LFEAADNNLSAHGGAEFLVVPGGDRSATLLGK
jgi:hypothetical protein